MAVLAAYAVLVNLATGEEMSDRVPMTVEIGSSRPIEIRFEPASLALLATSGGTAAAKIFLASTGEELMIFDQYEVGAKHIVPLFGRRETP